MERDAAFNFLNWVSFKYGFGTYIHMIEGFYNEETSRQARSSLKKLILRSNAKKNNVYIDTIISPSYTSALAQAIQLPGVSGMENNMIIFEYDKKNLTELKSVIDNFHLTLSGYHDVCVFGSSDRTIPPKSPIHVWIRSFDHKNSNLMILLSYIISGHSDWRNQP